MALYEPHFMSHTANRGTSGGVASGDVTAPGPAPHGSLTEHGALRGQVLAGGYLIRTAMPGDAEALAALKLATFRATFLEAFRIPYPPADLALFEAESYGLAKVRAELADPSHMTWVVEKVGVVEKNGMVEQDNTPTAPLIAYAHIGPCKLPHPDVRPGEWELYQIYLLPTAQGAGLGKRLLATALDYMTAHPVIPQAGGRIWLGVWSGNAKARAFYVARGFAEVGEYRFPVGNWRDDELILRRDAAPA